MLHLSEKPVPVRKFRPDAQIPKAVDAVVMKALEKEPDKRYQTVASLAEDLRKAVGAELPSGSGTYQGLPPVVSGSRLDSRKLIGALIAAFFLLGIGGYFGYRMLSSDSLGSDTVGEMKITSDPSGAVVYLDGEEKGRTPVLLKSVPVGTYQIILKKEGFGDVALRLKVNSVGTSDVNAKLIPLDLEEQEVGVTLEVK
jgi:hypothetical protein